MTIGLPANRHHGRERGGGDECNRTSAGSSERWRIVIPRAGVTSGGRGRDVSRPVRRARTSAVGTRRPDGDGRGRLLRGGRHVLVLDPASVPARRGARGGTRGRCAVGREGGCGWSWLRSRSRSHMSGQDGGVRASTGWVVRVRPVGSVQVAVPSGARATRQPGRCLTRWWRRHRVTGRCRVVGPVGQGRTWSSRRTRRRRCSRGTGTAGRGLGPPGQPSARAGTRPVRCRHQPSAAVVRRARRVRPALPSFSRVRARRSCGRGAVVEIAVRRRDHRAAAVCSPRARLGPATVSLSALTAAGAVVAESGRVKGSHARSRLVRGSLVGSSRAPVWVARRLARVLRCQGVGEPPARTSSGSRRCDLTRSTSPTVGSCRPHAPGRRRGRLGAGAAGRPPRGDGGGGDGEGDPGVDRGVAGDQVGQGLAAGGSMGAGAVGDVLAGQGVDRGPGRRRPRRGRCPPTGPPRLLDPAPQPARGAGPLAPLHEQVRADPGQRPPAPPPQGAPSSTPGAPGASRPRWRAPAAAQPRAPGRRPAPIRVQPPRGHRGVQPTHPESVPVPSGPSAASSTAAPHPALGVHRAIASTPDRIAGASNATCPNPRCVHLGAVLEPLRLDRRQPHDRGVLHRRRDVDHPLQPTPPPPPTAPATRAHPRRLQHRRQRGDRRIRRRLHLTRSGPPHPPPNPPLPASDLLPQTLDGDAPTATRPTANPAAPQQRVYPSPPHGPHHAGGTHQAQRTTPSTPRSHEPACSRGRRSPIHASIEPAQRQPPLRGCPPEPPRRGLRAGEHADRRPLTLEPRVDLGVREDHQLLGQAGRPRTRRAHHRSAPPTGSRPRCGSPRPRRPRHSATTSCRHPLT